MELLQGSNPNWNRDYDLVIVSFPLNFVQIGRSGPYILYSMYSTSLIYKVNLNSISTGQGGRYVLS